MERNQGFTVLELLVAISIMSLVAGLALPNVGATIDSFRRNEFLHELIADLNEARAKSLAEGSRVVFEVAEDGNSYSYGLDTLELNDPPSADSILLNRPLNGKNTLSVEETIIFSSRGFLVDEYGDPTNIELTLSRNGSEFCTGTLYSVGALEYDCAL